ncbi:NTP transferase domain-containing protein [Peribacillus glennii]|uniref:NTP transferase domain-containing protein n=1 Tax=Peribacillus glennii TaxID=2303991 RepID=UPI0022789EDE|nr:NTP transferase domain-containing protein [Peribacillus glennii]
MRIIGIYLAAGESKRMGLDKRSLPLNQIPLGSVALKQALYSKLHHIVVVMRNEDSSDWLLPSFFLLPFK